MWTFFLFLVAAFELQATSCASYEKVKACEIYHTTDVIFRGKVIDENGSPRVQLYKFQVTELFKGLPHGTKVVFVNPEGSERFRSGVDYLIYGSPGLWTRQSYYGDVRGSTSNNEAFPMRWRSLLEVPLIAAGLCNPSREIQPEDTDLKYLRSALQGNLSKTGYIEVIAAQNVGWPSEIQRFLPIEKADVTLTSGDKSFANQTGADGRLVVEELSAGAYEVDVSKPGFGAARVYQTGPVIALSEGGCAVVRVSLPTLASIRGSVVDWQGKPAGNIRLGLAAMRSDGKLKRLTNFTYSNEHGRFEFLDAPVGKILIGANIDSSPTIQLPINPTFLPGVADASKALIIEPSPGNSVDELYFKLPEPLPFGRLFVDVEWSNGSPAHGARAFAEWNGDQSAFDEAAPKTNRVTLPIALGRNYSIGANWIGIGPESKFIEGVEPKSIYFARDGQRVRIRLNGPDPKTPAARRGSISLSSP